MASLTEKQIGPGPVPVWDIQTASAGQIDACCGLGKGVNLLDNWYFGYGVINQGGQTSYTGARYTIDRWVLSGGSDVKLTVEPANRRIIIQNVGSTPNASLMQKLDERIIPSIDPNASMTASILVGNSVVPVRLTFGGIVYSIPASNTGKLRLLSFTRKASLASGATFTISANGITSGSFGVQLYAAKLELGFEQTLAIQDTDGDWVLADPPPNATLELLKCQRYFQTFATQSLRPVEAEDFRPAMRARPTLGTITVGGKTLYTASAEP